MLEIAYRTLHLCFYYVNTPLKELLEIAAIAVHVKFPAVLNKVLKLGEKLLNQVQIW